MTEKEYSPTMKEKKVSAKKVEKPVESMKVKEEVKEEKKTEVKKEEKKKKVEKVEIKPKMSAVVNGQSLHLSLKHCKAICRMIKGKSPERGAEMLIEVSKGKRAVPMRALEVPHQKGKGMAGGKFPKNAAEGIIDLLKQVRANAVVNQVENPVIVIAKADKASQPFRRNRRRAKRCHVYIEVKDRTKLRGKK